MDSEQRWSRRLNDSAIRVLPVLLLGCGPGHSTTGPEDLLEIHAIQGVGDASPFQGQSVRIRGVVTGDFQDYGASGDGRLGGFYVTSLEPDNDPASSEGLFIFEQGREFEDVSAGDTVDITGTVVEFYGETQVTAESVRIVGQTSVEATEITFPVADFERYEGMLLQVPERLLIAGNRNLGRFGTLTLAAGSRPYQFTNTNKPDPDGFRLSRERFARNSLILDDGLRSQNPADSRYAGGPVPPRAGNGISGLTGNLRWSRGSGSSGDAAFRLMPTAEPLIESLNPRRPPLDRTGNVRVASFNVLNLFSGLNDGEPKCGPGGTSNCRGANTARELERQLAKIVSALRDLDADIVGLAELENNTDESLELLVTALAAAGLDYSYVDAGEIGTSTIKVGLLYRPSRLEAAGNFRILDSSVDGRFDDRRNRPALAQDFALRDDDRLRLTVVVNHLKSKGSDCDDVNDPNLQDGQGNCNRTRTMAAAALADFAASEAGDNATGKVLVIGDLNAYLREDPIRALEGGGLVNLLDRETGGSAYSYVFDGRAGVLDYAFATPALAGDVVQVFAWHSNADEPQLFDYNLDFGRDPGLFDSTTPWRASDHDPVVVDIELAP